jgi:nucleotide-binding universal stress UspA family protein
MYTHILVPLDGSAGGERILPWLRPIARESKGIVRLLMVLPPSKPVVVENRVIAYVDQVEADARLRANAYLRQTAAPLLGDGIPVAVEVRCGGIVEAILAAVAEWGVDLIAIAPPEDGRTGRSLGRGVADHLLQRTSVPVLVARISGQRAA